MKPEDKTDKENRGANGESVSAPEGGTVEPAGQQQAPRPQDKPLADASDGGRMEESGGAAAPSPGAMEEHPEEIKDSEATVADGKAESESERLARELEEARQLAADNYDKYLRIQAEIENYKKRVQKERMEEGRYAHLPVMRDLMGILDNLKRAMAHAHNDSGGGVDGIIAGVEMVAKQLDDIFERHGMKRIKSVGEQFDPNMHEAMGLVESDEVPENQVMEEFEAGYFLHDRVVKPAMVTVSKKPAQADPAADAPQK